MKADSKRQATATQHASQSSGIKKETSAPGRVNLFKSIYAQKDKRYGNGSGKAN